MTTNTAGLATPHDILAFWFAPGMNKRWFRSTTALDNDIRERFEATWRAGADGSLCDWEDSAEGALALVIVLDQFPLNMYRGTAQSFATEAEAIRVSRNALRHGLDRHLPGEQKAFLYMPLMHSEELADQDECVRRFAAAGLSDNLRFARHHRELIRRFGRFPHRNAILGRDSTPEELEYLDSKEAFTG